jgi:predicted MPP superfamily phosphohydrolase
MPTPERRPHADRPRAPRPGRRASLPQSTLFHHVSTWLTRAVGRTWLGDWLFRRLYGALEFNVVPVRMGRLGARLDGLRVAFVSDLHVGGLVRSAQVVRIFDRLADLEPDLVVLGGDLIDAHPDDAFELAGGLHKLAAPHGVVAVPGNHDRGVERDLALWREALEANGVRVLINDGTRIAAGGDSLWVAGVDDLGLGEPDLERALRGCREDEPALLVTHQPDLFVEAAHVGVDLTLAGHTHGGQITFGGFAPWIHKYSRLRFFHGHYRIGQAQLYVGRGAGVTFLPLRIGAPPEIPILELVASQAGTGRGGPAR